MTNLSSKIAGISYRYANVKDAKDLLKVYEPYVTNTAITFEYDVPSVKEFEERIINISREFPYIVVCKDEKIIGYAYASHFHVRAAYQWSAELSIYLSATCHGLGIGRELYEIMEELLRKQNILNLYACIAYTKTEDEHLTNASMKFHSHMGYTLIGTFNKCGYKFGKWYDMIWMEKHIGEHLAKNPVFVPFNAL